MNAETRQKFSTYLETGLLFIWGISLFLFPLFFTPLTTDGIVLPKQILLGGVVLLSLLLWGVKMLLDGQVRIRRTPFDIPVLLFGVALLLSSVFAIDKVNSLIATVPYLYLILGFFVINNTSRRENSLGFLLISLLSGGALAGLVSLANHYKVYLLPFSSTHSATFTPFGTYLDQALYLAVLFIIAATLSIPLLKKRQTTQGVLFAGLGGIILLGLLEAVYLLFTSQKPNLLPFEVGFQTAFAAISQDAGRVAQGFFFGSGFGNYVEVFTRFKPISFNANPLWYITFGTSSSFFLELLATTGIVGILSYIFLIVKLVSYKGSKTKNPAYIALLLLMTISFLMPFSYTIVTLLFLLLAVFTLVQVRHDNTRFFEVEFQFVTLKKGIFSFSTPSEGERSKNNITPLFAFVFLLAIVVFSGFYTTTFVMSDFTFQKALVSASNNSGTVAYRLETQAITTFPYRSGYYRIFSQTNIALANSLLLLNTRNGASPSAQSQQTAFTLIQQAIAAGKTATTLSPASSIEWQNLASVYRTLIGIGQNADNFAIAATQQAVALDPTNPQEYLTLGGLYYQLGQYDNAIRQFQIAANLKQDYANAYYNIAHSYLQKQDYQNALAALQVVKQLIGSDKTNGAKVQSEIDDLQAKAGNQNSGATPTKVVPTQTQQQLSLPAPQATIPPQKQQLPLVSPSPTPGK